MSRMCEICGKGSIMVRHYNKLMSRYNPSPKIRKFPNLQKILIPVGTNGKMFQKFAGTKIKACAKCIKALGKTKK